MTIHARPSAHPAHRASFQILRGRPQRFRTERFDARLVRRRNAHANVVELILKVGLGRRLPISDDRKRAACQTRQTETEAARTKKTEEAKRECAHVHFKWAMVLRASLCLSRIRSGFNKNAKTIESDVANGRALLPRAPGTVRAFVGQHLRPFRPNPAWPTGRAASPEDFWRHLFLGAGFNVDRLH